MRLALSELAEKALALALGLFLLLALFRGGNTDAAITLALVGSLVVLAFTSLLALSRGRVNGTISSPAALLFVAALLMLLAVGAVALVPVSTQSWLALPGRQAYSHLVALLGESDFGLQQLPLSIDAAGTRRALLALAPCIAISIAVPLLSRRHLLRLLGAFVVLAAAEALLGLFQLGFRGASMLVLEYAGHNRASGTFVNKNHYATLLAMALPLLIFRATGQFSFFSHRHEASALTNVWWGVVAAFVAAALVASLSRAGVLAGGIVAVIALALCPLREHLRSRQVLFTVLALVALAVALAAMTGLGSLIRSVTQGGLGDGASNRTLMNAHTWSGIVAFFPFGAGLGSYTVAFQRFQTPSLLGFVEYAHNDYLQLLFETGLVGVVILILLALAAIVTGRTLWRDYDKRQRLSPAVACYLGALAFAIHAWFDFPAHIPAIAIIATLLFSASMNPALIAVGQRRSTEKTFAETPLLYRRARKRALPTMRSSTVAD